FAQYKHEYTITRSLDLACVVEAYHIEPYQDKPLIVFEDFGGESLDKLLAANTLCLEDFLTMAAKIVEAIGKIHAAGITHKDINPSNIVINPATGQLKIIDFGNATALSYQNPLIKPPRVLEGTLAYMSPEQTGRMNRTVDYRTDFYSLGITLYEMICHKRPFESTDSLQLVHSHIARMPRAPKEVNPRIPEAVSNVIMKLIAKNAEDRYQSSQGIRSDLEQCLDQWRNSGRIELFPLARHDVSDKFQIHKKLYGREKEIRALLNAFQGAVEGKPSLLLVAGHPGVGKSSLVREVYKQATVRLGQAAQIRFIAGKFDRLQHDIPYSAVVGAFRELIRQLLSESDAQLFRWRKKLLKALGPNGRIIIDVIPEFELIVGSQLPVPALGPVERQNRFNLVFQNFIQVFCRSEQPLTIFLDDLQWADAASLKLIELMMTDRKLRHLLVLGAYRDNEVDTDHPLFQIQESLTRKGASIDRISLAPLDHEHIHQMIADALQSSKKRVMPLAELIAQKTGGNPFSTEIFLKSLHTQELLVFDSEQGRWQWDLTQIQDLGITGNVVDLLAGKIQQFKEKTRRVLQLAACIGNPFRLDTLAKVSEMTVEDTAASLQEAVAEGLVLPMGHAYDVTKGEKAGSVGGLTDEYSFLHDRIQQAAYSLIAERERPAVHRQVGQHFLESAPADRKEDRIFDIVNQLNLGRELINNQTDRDELAQLNLKAGKKAKASAAFEAALNYLQTGIRLLGDDKWKRCYNLTLALHTESTEAAYLCGKYGEMVRFSEIVLRNANTLLDKINVYEVKIEAFKAQYKLSEALSIALFVLNELGVKFPERPKKINIIIDLIGTKLAMAGKRIESLVHLPKMGDPIKLASMQILNRVGSAAYFVKPELLPLVVFRILRFSVKYGNAPESAFAYAVYGMISCGVMGNIESGYRYGLLALRVLKHLNVKELEARTYHMVYGFIVHWKKHVRETIQPLPRAYQSGLETGDFEYAGFCAFFYCYHSLLSGRQLEVVENEMAQYSNAIRKLKHEQSYHMHEMFRQTVSNLRKKSGISCNLMGDFYDEVQMLPRHKQAKDRTTIYYLYFNKLLLSYLFGEYGQAIKNAKIAEQYLDGVTGMIVIPLFHFYDSLARLAVFAESPRTEQAAILKKVAANQKKMKKWAHHAPMNHLHKFYLVEAERLRILGRHAEAGEFYDQAIQQAQKHEYINEEALANELAGKFYLERGKDTIARAYLNEARDCYERWGARAKIRNLDERYGRLFSRISETSTADQVHRESTIEVPAAPPQANLDLATVMKASQAISGEIMMANLLKQLMTIIIENAGAQKGFLILNTDDQLQIGASIIADPPTIEILQSTPVEQRRDLSLDIVRFVSRSGEDLVIQDASGANQFDRDPYILRNQPKSILCMPIRPKDATSGVLYLENNLTASAFPEDRIQVLRILLSQAAISLENARLYEDLKQEIIDRKQVQEELLHLATAIEQAAEGIVITEIDGKVRYTNPAFERITGYSQQEIKGQKMTIFRSDQKDKSFYKTIWQSVSSGHVWTGRITTKKKDGTTCELEVTISPIRDGANNVISFVSVNRDVSREIQMEKELRQAQKMEAIGTLAGGIAHDFNNILSAIMGYTELALLDLPSDSSVGDHLNEVLTAGNRAKDLVEQILAFSRQNEQAMHPVEVGLIVKEALKLLRASLPATIEIRPQIEVDADMVLADPTQIHQVLMNLCTNAAHAMRGQGGTLEVRLVGLEVDASSHPNLNPGPYLRLTVKDSGHGIDHALLGRI
ncbi:MAG: AAA family ATPase, partial [Desulfobacterales bacterium]